MKFLTEQEKQLYENIKEFALMFDEMPKQPDLNDLAVYYHICRFMCQAVKEKYNIE